MDAKLKTKLTEALKAAENNYRKRHLRSSAGVASGDVSVAPKATKTVASDDNFGAKNAPKSIAQDDIFLVQKAPAFIYQAVRRKLLRDHVWAEVQRALAKESIEHMGGDLFRKHQRCTEDESQLPLPGFEYLPKRIQAGKRSLSFAKATVAQFLAYKADYEKRSEKNQLVVEELRRLAQAVAPFAQNEANLTLSEALQRVKGTGAPARLAIV